MKSKNIIVRDSNSIGVIVHNKKHVFHNHLAKEILFSSNGVRVKIKNREIKTNGIIINSNVKHEVYYQNNSVVVYVDVLSDLSRCLDLLYLKGGDYYILPVELLKKIFIYLENNDVDTVRRLFYKEFCNEEVLTQIQEDNVYDDRIVKVLDLIERANCLEPNLFAEMAEACNLSKSRFSHLFKECTGVSFKSYILSKRLEKTFYYSMEEGLSMTDAAYKAGFSSGTHFSYAFQKNYGISFRDFKLNK